MPPERVIVPDTVLIRQLQAESVLLDLASETYFGLDDVGTAFWAALIESESVEAAGERLQGEFEIESATLLADLRAFVAKLSDAGLVRVVPV